MSDFEQRLRTGLRQVADEAHEPFDPAGQVRERIGRRARRQRARLAAGALAATVVVGAGTFAVAADRSGEDVVVDADRGGLGRTVLAAAVDETAAAGSFRFETTVGGLGHSFFGAPGGADQPDRSSASDAPAIEARGVFDYGARRGRVTSQLPAALPGGGRDVEVVLDATSVYVHLPEGNGRFFQLPEGKEWVRIDANEHGGGGDDPLGSFFGGGDPTDVLDRLRQEGATVDEVGREDVRDVATTRYRYTFEAASRSGGQDQSPHPGSLAPTGDVWIDDEGRLRRVTSSFDGPDAPQDRPGGTAFPAVASLTTTTEFFDFGTAVDVSPPPAEDVANVSELGFAQLGGGDNGPPTPDGVERD